MFKEPPIEWQQAGKCLTETRNESILNNKNLMKRKQHIDKAKRELSEKEKCVNEVGKTKKSHNKAKASKIKSIKH